MMKNICGINCTPLVLGGAGCPYFIALSGYANDFRTVGAQKNNTYGMVSHILKTLSGYVNDFRTVSAQKNNTYGIVSRILKTLSGYVNDFRTFAALRLDMIK